MYQWFCQVHFSRIKLHFTTVLAFVKLEGQAETKYNDSTKLAQFLCVNSEHSYTHNFMWEFDVGKLYLTKLSLNQINTSITNNTLLVFQYNIFGA